MKVSLIIPTYNKLPRLKLLLTSLNNQSYPKGYFEAIIIDDGSIDGTSLFLKEYKPDFNLKYIIQKNGGRASTRNKGIALAKNELLIFIDDDLILSPCFIEEHVRLQKEKQSVVHGKIINLPYLKFFEDPTNGVFYPSLLGASAKGDELKSMCLSEEDIMERFESKIACNTKTTALEEAIRIVLNSNTSSMMWIAFNGGNTSVPKQWIKDVGGFDEGFGLKWGCEDLELGYRLLDAQKSFVYGHSPINYHMAHYRANFDKEHLETASYFYKKHNDENIIEFQKFVEGKLSKSDFIEFALQTNVFQRCTL